MNRIIKALAVVLAVAMLMAAASACAGKQGGMTLESGKLIMATNAEFPPFEFINDAGEFDGFDVQLAKAIADKLDLELVVDNMQFDAIIAAIETGQVDVGIAAMTITEERLLKVNFTIPYFETTLVVIVPVGSDITSRDDLEYARIAVQLGTTSDLFVEDELENATITRLARAPDTVLELQSGNVDAIVVDRDVALQFIDSNPDLVMLPESLGEESYGMAVNKGNPELLAELNRVLNELKDSGEYDRIFDAWFTK